MAFLSDKKVILQDLALRNCWLDAGFVLKLSDGALSQDFYPECYTSIKGAVRSVKWAAIETLQEGLITVQSNVVRWAWPIAWAGQVYLYVRVSIEVMFVFLNFRYFLWEGGLYYDVWKISLLYSPLSLPLPLLLVVVWCCRLGDILCC